MQTISRASDAVIVEASLWEVLNRVALESPKHFRLEMAGTSIRATCPFHSNGTESIPSCYFSRERNGNVPQGFCHCFGCGYVAPIDRFISDCFGRADGGIFGANYILKKFSGSKSKRSGFKLDSRDREEVVFKENIKPCVTEYLTKRGIHVLIQKLFNTGLTERCFNGRTYECVAFPVYDEAGMFKHYAFRATKEKIFHYPAGVVKPVYGLPVLDGGKSVFVAESIINALSLWSWGYEAIALNGTGTEHQYNILRKQDIREYYLCFDGDSAGDRGLSRFKAQLSSLARCYSVVIPRGEDVNSLGRVKFEKCLII